MQALNGGPRSAFTAAQVEALLLSDNIEVDYGLELLNPDLTVLSDVSNQLVRGEVSFALDQTIHRTCTLELTNEVTWGVTLVRPYMTISGQISTRWNLGVYVLTSPKRKVGATPPTFSAQGYDRISLLDREIGAAYSVTSGTTYRTALLGAFADAGLSGVYIEGSAADDTLPVTKTWPLVRTDEADPDQTDTPATWLRVVNDLLRAINFRSVWCNEEGIFQCVAYQEPAVRASTWTFDADDEQSTIVGEDREYEDDTWQVPNKWVFIWSNRPGGEQDVEGDGKYTVTNQSNGVMSIDSRGLEWVRVFSYEAATQAKLEELGDRRAAEDQRRQRVIYATTGTFPAAGHADIYTYKDADLAASVKVQAVQWKLPLDRSPMTWTWERVQ